jgi:hypothetical protein
LAVVPGDVGEPVEHKCRRPGEAGFEVVQNCGGKTGAVLYAGRGKAARVPEDMDALA